MRLRMSLAKHPSEWQGKADAAKWNVIKESEALLKNDPKRLKHELERIDELSWWDEIQGVKNFPASPSVWHFNPVMFVDNLRESGLITMAMLAAVDPHGSETKHAEILPYLNKYAVHFDVNTPKRIAHFISQISVESHFMNTEEGLDYNGKRMREVFGCRGGLKNYRSSTDDCSLGRLRDKLWSQEIYYAHNPEHLGNYVYASREGNGDETSGAGFRYRGRGLIQMTFKSKYKILTDEHKKRFPDDPQDFLNNPDIVLNNLEYGVESAFVFWGVIRGVNLVADSGNVRAVTKAVNGGENGYSERKKYYNDAAPILRLPFDEQ
jgi:predicted chitinase